MENLSKRDYYSDTEYISNSMLGWLNRSPAYFKACIGQDFERKDSLTLERGKLLHMSILEPEKFIVADIEPVGGMMGEFVKKLVEVESIPDMFNGPDIANKIAYEHSGFKQSFDTVIKKFNEDESTKKYYNFLKSANGKISIDKNTKYVLDKCKESLVNNTLANTLLIKSTDTEEHYVEIEIYSDNFLNMGFKAKGKIDRLIINKKEGWAIVVDLKTTSKPAFGRLIKINKTGMPQFDYRGTGFMQSYIDYSYYRQLTYYSILVAEHFKIKTVNAYIIPVETSGMFECCVYKHSQRMYQEGIKEIGRLIKNYQYYEKNGWNKHVFIGNNDYLVI